MIPGWQKGNNVLENMEKIGKMMKTLFAAPGTCPNGKYGDGSNCTSCPEDTFSTLWNTSVATSSDCEACSTGHSTNGASGQTACTCMCLIAK